MGIVKTFRDIARLKTIVNVLFKQELGYYIHKINLGKFAIDKKSQKVKEPDSVPIRIRKSMEELGGAFLKLGQALSLRLDLIPKEYCDEFSKLQDNVKPIQYNDVKKIIEKEFNKPIEKIFSEFKKEPIASASVGQVHEAKLITGERVAVKVQRPDVEKQFMADIDLLYYLAGLLNKHVENLKHYNLKGLIKEFEDYTKKELDYNIEANNIERFHRNFEKHKSVVIPKVFLDHTTKRVLTMEFIDGISIKYVKDFKKYNTTKKNIVKIFNDCFVKQILEDRFFHADPHPGNVFVLKNNKIALLDFGIIGSIDQDTADAVEGIFTGVVTNNMKLVIRSFLDLGIVNDETDTKLVTKDLEKLFDRYHNTDINKIDMSYLMHESMNIARKYRMRFPLDIVLLFKSVATVEGFYKQFDPSFNYAKAFQPKILEIKERKESPEYLIKSAKKNLFDLKYSLKKIPESIELARKRLKEGKVKVDLDDSDIYKFALELDRSSNRLTYGIIIGSLIITAGLSMLANIPPYVFGLPLLGLFCMVIALLMALILMVSINREKEVRKIEKD